MTEIFKEIIEYPKYKISNHGSVIGPNGTLTPYKRIDGYEDVKLYKHVDGKSVRKGVLIHKLVAEAFVENLNPNTWTIVNHKNSDRSDNYYENLEWCNYSMNSLHASAKNITNGSEKPCGQYSLNDELIQVFSSLTEAASVTGLSYSGIAKACKGTAITSCGYKWKYTDDKHLNPEIHDVKDWETIDEFPSYKISRNGKIYSKEFKTIAVSHDHGGSLSIKLTFWGEYHIRKIHRLVAEAYIPNPDNLPNVSHINGNKYDNSVENLMWCTQVQSVKHAVNLGKIPKPKGKTVMQYEIDGTYIKTFKTIKRASELTNSSATTIALVCNNKRQTSGGFKWKWG